MRYIFPVCLMFAVLSSCFTGVESTPKITANDVKRQDAISISAEAMLIATLPVDSIDLWQPGKEFIVVDRKGAIIFSPRDVAQREIAKGTVLRYNSLRYGTSVTGEKDVTIDFVTPTGAHLEYNTATTGPIVNIPFTVNVEVVDSARRLLKNRRLWVTTSIWRDSVDNVVGGYKYVPVVIDDVVPGTADYPIRIDFSTTDVETTQAGMLYISTTTQGAGSRKFETQFSLTDPRKRYPDIEENTWQLIQRGMLAVGMSRDECRLSIGPPRDIERRAGYSSVREVWSYENGIYLIFSDGILIDYRR